ncbi:hypothetical protein FKM82_007010 [Ascaphus truei]
MEKHGEQTSSSGIPKQLDNYYYAVQNPQYHPAAPDSQQYLGASAPVYMPPPPLYSLQDPEGLTAPTHSSFPPPHQPQQFFFQEGSGPRPYVGASPPEYHIDMMDSSPFLEKSIRRAFIRKVYITLAIQLVITVGLICMFIFWKTLRYWVQDYPYFAYALLACTFVLVLVLACCDKARRKVPLNFILLGLFTVFEGCMLGAISALFEVDAVMWAVGATVFVTLGLTLFALQTKWDFTNKSGSLCVALLVLLSFGLLCAIIRSSWLQILYASIGTLIFGMYLVVDTQLILGGKHRYSISPEDYIFAALNIYLDIVNLFLLLLQIFGLCR